MGFREKFISLLKKSFGNKKVESVEDVEMIESNIENSIDFATRNIEGEFDKSIKVDIQEQISTKYEPLPQNIKQGLRDSFKEFKEAILSTEESTNNTIKEQNEGTNGKNPFLCFVEIDSSGKIVSTIIITDKSAIKISKDENGDVTYQETRKTKNGMQTIINDKNGSMSIAGNVSQEKIEKMKLFAKKSDKALLESPTNISDKDMSIYEQTLEKLGVDTNIDINNKQKYGRAGTGLSKKDSDIITGMSYIYDKSKDFSVPESICLSSMDNEKFSSRTFRRTQDGKYIDCSSFKVIDGQAQYKLVTFEQIQEYALKTGYSDSISQSFFNRYEQFSRKCNDLIPKAAVGIHDNVVQQHEKATEEPQVENDDKTI